MKNFSLSQFKKVHEDQDTAVLQHPDGHHIVIAKKPLSPQMKKQVEALPVHKDDGGLIDEALLGADQPQAQAALPVNRPTLMPGGTSQTQGPALIPASQIAQLENMQHPDTLMQAQQASQQGANGPTNVAIPQPQARPQPGQGMAQTAGPQGMNMFMKGVGQERAGIQQQAQAQAQQGQAEAQASGQAADQLKLLNDQYNGRYQQLMTEYNGLKQDYINGNIDPNHYMDSMSTGSKVASAIGLMLGQVGSAFTHGPNAALQFLDSQMNRDLEAQKLNLGKKESLLSANLRMFGNLNDATQMTKAMQLGILSAKIQQAGAAATSPAAQAQAKQLSGALDQKVGQAMWQMSMSQVMGGQGSLGSGPGGSTTGIQVNPEFLSPEQRQRLVPLPKGQMGMNGGYGVAASPEEAQNSRQAISSLVNIKSGLDQIQQDMKSEGRTLNPWGTRASTAEDLQKGVVQNMKQLFDSKRMTPEEQKQWSSMVPSPGAWNEGKAQSKIDTLNNMVQQKLNDELQYHLENFSAPPTATPNHNTMPGYNAGGQ